MDSSTVYSSTSCLCGGDMLLRYKLTSSKYGVYSFSFGYTGTVFYKIHDEIPKTYSCNDSDSVVKSNDENYIFRFLNLAIVKFYGIYHAPSHCTIYLVVLLLKHGNVGQTPACQ